MAATRPSADNPQDRPLVTFAVITYNQERTILEALAGAFAQTYSPLEIILSDDCSSDRTFEIMSAQAAAYSGPHRLVLNRNAGNLNIGGHVNRIGQLAAGSLVILAAGDDVSLPCRTERIVRCWVESGQRSGAFHSDFEAINAEGGSVPPHGRQLHRYRMDKEVMASGDIHVLGATTAFTRDVWSRFPPLLPTVQHEDRVFPFRALLLGGRIHFIPERLVRYRVEGGVSTRRAITARHYLYDYLPTLSRKILPDAFQRLGDLDTMTPPNSQLRRLCLMVIAEQESVVAMAASRGLRLEVAVLRAFRCGARWSPTVRLYLRFRLFPVFKLFFRRGNVS